VLGVAVIQALLVGVGLVFAGVPGAGLWVLLCLILGIAQLPLLLVTGPIIFYVFQGDSSGTATIFAIWMVIASSSDMFLKPIFLGRGLDVPMPVILVGAIGGMMSLGILGLFLGAVVLAVFHRVFMAWVQGGVRGAEGTEA
jgi:predicted PurR-regulated permease PerM